jgi:hypothetical protein
MKSPTDHKCEWIGDDEGCTNSVKPGKSYCEKHYDRIYLKLLPEMANYIVDKEVNETFNYQLTQTASSHIIIATKGQT